MSLTKLTDDLNIVAALSDTPNATDGLSAAQLKAKFDEGSLTVQDYLNNTLTSELDSIIGASRSMKGQAVINGNFDKWVRGTSFTNPLTASYTADRWQTLFSNSGTLPTTITHARLQLTAGDVLNSYYGYRLTVNGAGSGFGVNDFYLVAQKIEHGVRNLCGNGQKITVSFYAKSNISGKKLGISGLQIYGSGGSPTSGEIIQGQVLTLTSSWARYTVTLNTNTLVGKTFGTSDDDYVSIVFNHMWGSTYGNSRFGASTSETFVGSGDIDIAQIQVNSGSSSLSFQPRSIAQEELLCSRYAKGLTEGTNTQIPIGTGFAISTTIALINVDLGVAMRVAPSLTATASDWQLSDGVTSTDVTSIAIQTNQKSTSKITLQCAVASGLTQFRPYQLIADSNAGRLMIFSSEL